MREPPQHDDPAEPQDAEAAPVAEGPEAPMVFPPLEPDTADGVMLQRAPAPVEQTFASLDPELVSQSIQVTATPASPLPSGTQRASALWRDWVASRVWLLAASVALFLICVPRTTESVIAILTAEPLPGLLSIAVWVLYAIPLIWVIQRFDFFERESSYVNAAALAWGGVIASTMAVSANQAMFSLFTSAFGSEFTAQWGAALAAPTTEEVLKAIGIVAIALLARHGIRSAIDGFVIGAVLGLGFQVMEDFVYTGNLLISGVNENPYQTVLNVFLVRGLGSGLWSHAAYSGVAGLGIGYALTRTDRTRGRRLLIMAVMLAAAWFMHFLWNYPVPAGPASGLWSLVKAAAIVGLVLWILMRNAGRDSYIYTEYLQQLHDPGLVTDEEIEQLRTYRSRQAAVNQAARGGGERAASGVRMLQRAQADLSVAMANGDIEGVATARSTIAVARSRIGAAAMLPEQVGHKLGVAAIWMAVIGIVLPLIGPLAAAVLAWLGTRQAHRAGAAVADTVRWAWILVPVSAFIGLALFWLLPSAGVP